MHSINHLMKNWLNVSFESSSKLPSYVHVHINAFTFTYLMYTRRQIDAVVVVFFFAFISGNSVVASGLFVNCGETCWNIHSLHCIDIWSTNPRIN